MASFTGPIADPLDYEVVFPESWDLTGTRINHVREQNGSKSLCGHSCDFMDGWSIRDDWHPEDVDADERCQRCYSILEARKRRLRGERPERRRRSRRAQAIAGGDVTRAIDVARARKRRDAELEQRNRDLAAMIRVARDDGESMVDLAKAMGMTRQALYLYVERNGGEQR